MFTFKLQSTKLHFDEFFQNVILQFFKVLDGGAIIIRGQPRNGPPPERTIALAEIEPFRMARRPGPTNPGSNDDPWAWEAREFLRKMLIGKSVLCSISHKVPSGREYGQVLFGSTDPDKAENVAIMLLSEGQLFVY